MTEIINQFGIDWKMLIAQAVNFFVLLYILKTFAFKPVINILNKRKEDVEKGIKLTREAEKKSEEIGKEREEIILKSQNKALELMNKAEKDAKEQKDEILKDAEHQAENVLINARKIAEDEKLKMEGLVYENATELLKISLAKIFSKMRPDERDEFLIKEALAELETQGNK